ncbi:maltose ABC transporter permease [Thermotoga sp. RQ7]|uniref:Maltose/maltodextrin transport system permease protein MalG n=2 Tax=Thermotoga neapolitana TaxID=2337 RepID=B9K9B2_THENN|nr:MULTISPECIES: sugar ABC transporter permease [Thermotoga]ACM23545.1 Maltose ABC transporter, permease protein [Thermotoga neapolitana DSM 4359]AJG41447.1 maltose ABC transporter permease [Thermotoga sp. RQ7]
MMVQKRGNVLTHIFLIIIVAVILFPVVWVVTTSLRRDEAAFSSKLFSSRLTLQHYRDLVAPEKNLPFLIQDLQAMVSRVKPYDTWSEDELKDAVKRSIEKVASYLTETENRLKSAEDSFKRIEAFLNDHSDEIKNSVIENLQELVSSIQTPELDDSDESKAALYLVLSKERFNSKVHRALEEDLKKTTGVDASTREGYEQALEILRTSYEKLADGYDELLEKTQKELNAVREEILSLQQQYQNLQDDIMEANLIIEKDITPELERIKASLSDLNELKERIKQTTASSLFPVDDSSFLQNVSNMTLTIDNLLSEMDSLVEYENLRRSLATLKGELEKLSEGNEELKSRLLYSDLIKIYEEIQPRLVRILKETSETLTSIKDKIVILNVLNKRLEDLRLQEKSLSEKLSEYQQSISEIHKRLLEPQRILSLKVFKYDLQRSISTLERVKSFGKTDLLRYSSVLKTLRDFMNSYWEKDELYSRISKVVRGMRWIEEYRDFASKFDTFPENLKSILEEMRLSLSDLERSYEDLLSLSAQGVYVSSGILNRMYDIVKMDFVSKVRANMSVASRRAGILMDLVPFSDLKGDLRNIDKELFRIDQIWKQKTKHYFWLWVLNSVIVSLIVAFITTTVCAIAAYPFSRMRFLGRRYGIMALLLIQMFPGVIFMIAIYDLLNFMGKYIPFIGIDTLGGLIFAYLTNIAYNMYLIKGFYDTIPTSLEEAAIVDGATRFQSFYRIIIPLARPILTVVFLLVFIGTFNEYVVARIILQNVRHYTYALGLQAFATGPYETEWGLFTAAALLGMTPMVILFLSLQRYLVSGLTRGAVKE